MPLKLDSRLRGNDGEIAALDAEIAEVLQTIRFLDSNEDRHSRPRHSREGGNPALPCHSRAGGNLVPLKLDSRLRGNDGAIAALDAESAEVLQTLRGLI